jgi:geranylgeranyl diphosphate synthase type II
MTSSRESAGLQEEDWLARELADRRRLVESALEDYLPAETEPPETLHQAMRYAVLNGGKRLRPILVLAAAEVCGGQTQATLPATVAMEFVHCYSLVHDDLPAMDDDDLRRGRPTCHKAYGEAMAILVGDALLTLAFEVLTTNVADSALAGQLVKELSRAAGHAGMVAGQVVDMLSEGSEPSEDVLDYIHTNKTGALITAALRLGALTADAAPEQLSALTDFGRRIGLAFQIADDILDVTSTVEDLGKSAQKDLDRGKLTFPALVGVEESRRRAAELVEAAATSLGPFGDHARFLQGLASFVVTRSR